VHADEIPQLVQERFYKDCRSSGNATHLGELIRPGLLPTETQLTEQDLIKGGGTRGEALREAKKAMKLGIWMRRWRGSCCHLFYWDTNAQGSGLVIDAAY